MDLQLTKKIALVSGSTAGIGNAIATSLAHEGATVIVNGRTSAAVDAAVSAMKMATNDSAVSPMMKRSSTASASGEPARCVTPTVRHGLSRSH